MILTAYNAEIKMRAFEAGCLKPALALLRSRERVVLQNTVATIRNLSFHPEVKVRLVEDGALKLTSLCVTANVSRRRVALQMSATDCAAP